jgi:hypothetical protein
MMITVIVMLIVALTCTTIFTAVKIDQLRGKKRVIAKLEREINTLEQRRKRDREDARNAFWEQFVCGCTHHYVYHDRSDGYAGECEYAVPIDQATLADAVGQRFRELIKVERSCRCQGYVGPVPPTNVQLEPPDLTSSLTHIYGQLNGLVS